MLPKLTYRWLFQRATEFRALRQDGIVELRFGVADLPKSHLIDPEELKIEAVAAVFISASRKDGRSCQ